LDFTVVAPHDKGLPEVEEVDGIQVRRFRYASDENETLAYRGEMNAQIKSRPFAVYKFLQSYKRAAMREAGTRQYDAIWAHWWLPGGWAGEKAAKSQNIPLIVTCHGTDVFLLNKFFWLKTLARKVFGAATRSTVVSSFLKQQLVDSLKERVHMIDSKITVAPMPVNESVFYHDPKVEPVRGSIISASRLTRQKHLDKLIKAAARLRDDGIEFRIDVYGDGPEREALTELVRRLGLDSIIELHGAIPQSELADHYRKSEIAVLVSEREGFGLMLLEAMLCGCVGIGAASGGITDIVAESGKDGMIVPVGDVDSLYGSLKNLLTNRELLDKMRVSCREAAKEQFSARELNRTFEDILRKY